MTRSMNWIGTILAVGGLLSCFKGQAQSLPTTAQTPISQTPNREASQSRLQSSIFAAPPPPPDIGAPGQRTEAGSRPRSCRQVAKPLIALVPLYSKNDSEVVWALTTRDRPTFWFYVPYSSASAYGELVLENHTKQQTIYKVPLAATPGVVKVTIPNSTAPLTVNQRYRWYFNIYCQNVDELDSFVEGSLQRLLNPTLQSQLAKALPQKQVELYAVNGIWHDALTTAAELRRTQSNDPNWTKLLQTVGLSNVAQEVIVDCCNARKN